MSKLTNVIEKITGNKSSRIPILLIGFAVLLVIVVLIFVRSINNATYETVVVNMEEVANRDTQTVLSYQERCFDNVNSIEKGILYETMNNSGDIQKYLNRKGAESTVFDSIYFVTDKGTVYDSKFIINKSGKHPLVQNIKNHKGSDRFVSRFDSASMAGYTDSIKERLIYAARTDISVGSEKIEYVVGAVKITNIKKDLKILVSEENSYSIVFDENGDYIVNIGEKTLTARENFYEVYSEGKLQLKDMTADGMRQMIESGESFVTVFTDTKDSEEYIMAIAPFGEDGYTLGHVVPYSTYTDRSHHMILICVSLVATIALALFLLALVVIRTNSEKIKADEMARTRADFLSSMSHEIRTPLNGIIGINHLMGQHLGDRDKMETYLKKLKSTSTYLLTLINDVLDISKMQAGKLDLVKEPFAVEAIASNAYSMYAETMEEKDIEFKVNLDIINEYIYGDSTRFQQVILNLLSNAAKFTPAGGTVEIRVSQKPIDDDQVETIFAVSDTGCGMTEEFKEHIFEEFSQDRNANDNSIKGTGLGMAISYNLIKQMNGDIMVESELNKGSTFTVVLPAEIASKEELVEMLTGDEIESDSEIGSLNILIAEDNELNADILQEVLEDEGFTSDLAENGQIAVDMFKSSKPGEYNLILMDVQMPVMNGYEAVKAIRALDREDAKAITIFACTANTTQDDRISAEEAGMNDFITKPVDINELISKLNNIKNDR